MEFGRTGKGLHKSFGSNFWFPKKTFLEQYILDFLPLFIPNQENYLYIEF